MGATAKSAPNSHVFTGRLEEKIRY